ncbi:hypothetical protein NDU88_000513 [Pleurodeles waltl]|uniref:Uncharacterized protein n=1 Tax=Pleurodeles waltl TaxID=8319 RepID=A0AAV7MS28_PLEWA|nr:hypothetical protein NDU88_000513 [Pleurodeles waltl]
MTHESWVQAQIGRAIDQAGTGKVKLHKGIETNECSTIAMIEHKAATDSTLPNGNEHGIVKNNSTPTGEQAASSTGETEAVTALEQLATAVGGVAVVEGAVNKKQPLSTSQPAPVVGRSIKWDKETETSLYINNDALKLYEMSNRKVTTSPATRYQFQDPLTQGRSNQLNGRDTGGIPPGT